MFQRIAILAVSLATLQPAAAAAPDPAAPLVALQKMDSRVAAIAHRLAVANVAICARTQPVSGLTIHTLDQYGADSRAAAAAAFGLGSEPSPLVVVPGSAAARAGLQPGDHILAIGGQAPPPQQLRSRGRYQRVAAIEEALQAALEQGPVRIDYRRGDEALSAMVEPEPGCVSRVQIVPSLRLKASADGTYVQLTSAMVEYARSDDELALVIAHEMAHNILAHREALDAQKITRGIFKSLDGSAAKIRRTEVEADYLALYLMARAGFDPGAAPAFWRRLGPGGLLELFSDGTHPGQADRAAAAEATLAEIRALQDAGQPLVPRLTDS